MGKTMEYKGYLGTIEVSLEDNCLFGKIEHINDLVTYEGREPAVLRRAFEEQVDDYIEMCKELGQKPDKPFSGTFNVRIGPKLHKQAAIYAKKTGVSLNEVVKTAIQNYINKLAKPVTQHINVYQMPSKREQGPDFFTQDITETGSSNWIMKETVDRMGRR